MITLFRRFREKLIASGSITKYLVYAIGEILLVVIGILIALQVNTWNEQRKLSALELDLLTEIRNDLIEDSLAFSSSIENFGDQLSAARLLKEHMKASRPYHDSLTNYFSNISLRYAAYVETGGYESLENAGFLTITTDSLRKRIMDYYDFSILLESVRDRYNLGEMFRDKIYPTHFQSFSWGADGAVPSDYGALLESNEFYIALDYVINDSGYYQRQYQALLRISSELREHIQNILDS